MGFKVNRHKRGRPSLRSFGSCLEVCIQPWRCESTVLWGTLQFFFFCWALNRCAALLYLPSRNAYRRTWQLGEADWICCCRLNFSFFSRWFFFIWIIEAQYVTNEKFNETLCPRGAGPIPLTDYEISYFPSHRGMFFNIAQYKCLVPRLGRSAEATQRRRELQRDIT